MEEAYDERRDTLVRMFPEYDVDTLLASMTNATIEQIADWCLNNPDRVPKKRKADKRKNTISSPAQSDSDSDLDFDDVADGLLLDRLIRELLAKLKKELTLPNNKLPGITSDVRYLICAIYPKAKMEFIKQALSETENRVFSVMIMGFFISNKLSQRLIDSMQKQSTMWLHSDIMMHKRKRSVVDIFEGDMSIHPQAVTAEIRRFASLMAALTDKYPQILNRIELLPDAFKIQIDVPDDIEKFSCGVCFDEFTVTRRIMCGTPEAEGAEVQRHSFCRTCVKAQAKAVTEDMPLHQGGVGLKCMDFDCKSAIYYSSVRSLIPRKVRRKIDERIMEEDLGKSGLALERCRECNFAIEMEQTKESNKVFACPNCEKSWCRLCERSWDDEHFGLSCAEVDAKDKDAKKNRDLEKKLNDAVIRKCRCGLQFTKADGCNKMTCRCGTTQCYICREEKIDYSHFCQHVRNPGIQQCKQCTKKCTLWANANELDEKVLNQIRAEAGVEPEPGPSRIQPPPHAVRHIVRPVAYHEQYMMPPPPHRQANYVQNQVMNFGLDFNPFGQNVNFNVNLVNYGRDQQHRGPAERFVEERQEMEARRVAADLQREAAFNFDARRIAADARVNENAQRARRVAVVEARRIAEEAQRAEMAGRRAMMEGRRAEMEGRRAEMEGRRVEMEARRIAAEAQRTAAMGARRVIEAQRMATETRRVAEEQRSAAEMALGERRAAPLNRPFNYNDFVLQPEQPPQYQIDFNNLPVQQVDVRVAPHQNFHERRVKDEDPPAVAVNPPPDYANRFNFQFDNIQNFMNADADRAVAQNVNFDQVFADNEEGDDEDEEEEEEEADDEEDMEEGDIEAINVPQPENQVIDLTDGDNDVPIPESDKRILSRIRDEGERFEVMPVDDVRNFVKECSQLHNDWKYCYEMCRKLRTTTEKLKEGITASSTGREQEKVNNIINLLNRHEQASNTILDLIPQLDDAFSNVTN